MIDLSYDQITGWLRTCANMKHFKIEEASQRKKICDELFEDKTGRFTKNITVSISPPGSVTSTDYKVVGTSKTSFKIDEETLQTLKDEGLLTEADEACFERNLSVKEGPLRKLPKDSAVWTAITEKPGMPTLTIEEVKDEA